MLLKEDFVKCEDTGLFCVTPQVVKDGKLFKQSMKCYEASQKGYAKGRTRSNSTSNKPSPYAVKVLRNFFYQYDKLLFNLIGRKLW